MLLTTFDALGEFDRITRRAFAPASAAAAIRMDAIRRPQEIELRFDLPGIDAGSLEVTVDRGVLSVTAQRSQEFGEDEKPVIRQRFMGSYAHRVRLSESVNADAIEASYEGGVLTVRVPLREKAQPRKVEVRAAAAVQAPGTEAHGTEAEAAGTEGTGRARAPRRALRWPPDPGGSLPVTRARAAGRPRGPTSPEGDPAVSPLPLDNADLPLFTVGQVASMLEIQQAFLRRLDEHQVVRPSRSGGGQRRYTRNEITVVQYVVQLVDEGMTLNAIRRVLRLEALVRELEAERDALREALADRDDRLAALRAARTE